MERRFENQKREGGGEKQTELILKNFHFNWNRKFDELSKTNIASNRFYYL